MGLIVSLFGPPFSGKTYLTTNLIHDFDDFEIVIFEKFFTRDRTTLDDYKDFINCINNHLSNNKNVIVESIYSLGKNPFISVQYKKVLNVLCWPSLEKYKKNYGTFLSRFGKRYTERRLSSNDLIKTRSDFYNKAIPEEYITFNGNNYGTIKRDINKLICI